MVVTNLLFGHMGHVNTGPTLKWSLVSDQQSVCIASVSERSEPV